jgi:outer membrane protein OmpA-like peptidoglycan-associated protein
LITSKHTRVALIGTLLAAATAGAESGPFNLHFEPGLAASLADFRSGQAKQVGAGPGFDFAAKLDIPVYKGLAVQVMASTQALPVEVRRSNLYAVGAGVRWRFVDDHKGYRFHMPGDPKTGNWLGNYWVDAAVLTTGEQKLGTLGVELGMGAEASLVDGLQAGPLLKFTYADQLLTTTLGISISIAKDPGEAQDKDNDGFVDEKDKCPAEAEDKDGFQDDDGCPEADNDADGIADAADKCPGEAEDKDGFQDDDGCPEADNDADGIADAADKCPGEAEDKDGFQDDDGCPEKDNDADGIADAADKCPGEAEDKDGFQDDDGCPEKDNDNDGIPDAADKCPVEPETVNGKDDTDGCPEKEATVFITKEKVTITDKVFFNVGKSTLQSKSEALLTEVANVLVKFPRVKKVRVEGHTDNTGKAEKNLKLSSERAKAVVDFLVKKGVAKERLEAVGYGAEKPLDSADTEEAREKNRRVEFTILEQDAAE